MLREQPLKYGRSHSVWITTVEEWSWVQPHMGSAPESYGVCRNTGTGCQETKGENSQRCISQQLMLHHVPYSSRECVQHTKYQGGVNYTSVSASIDALFFRATLTSVNAESCLAVVHRPTFCVD